MSCRDKKFHTLKKKRLSHTHTLHHSHPLINFETIIPNPTMSSSSGTIWSYEEEKSFENAIAMHWNEKEEENSNEQWEKIASCVPNKSMEEVKQHYQLLVDDVSAIEAGHVSFPNYANELETTTNSSNKDSSKSSTSSDKRSSSCNFGSGFSGLGHDSNHHSSGKGGLSRSSSEQERRKGIPWTEEEHRY
jgi:hypothetical protein